jgi:hypothetical protein
MDIRCTCGKFHATLKAFPRSTPGRLVCYCDDCQAYLKHLQREDLLDANGGTEVIPAYPADVQIVSGAQYLKCTRLSPKGMFRFSTTCCNTPIANVQPKAPWVGLLHCVYPADIAQTLGPVRSRIMGRYAKGTPPAGTPNSFDLKALASVLPFMLKGALLRKQRPSPFFAADGVTPIVVPTVLGDVKN